MVKEMNLLRLLFNKKIAQPAPAEQHPIGVVSPSNDKPFLSVSGFPLESDMASAILPELRGQAIANEQLPPLTTPNRLIKFSVKQDQKKVFFAIQNSFTLFEFHTNKPYFGLRAFEQRSLFPIPGRGNRIAIRINGNAEPLILCRQLYNINKKYVIHGRYPLHEADTSEDTEGGVPFYPWFMVRDIDDSHLNFRSVQIWNGKNYEPYLHIRSAKNPREGKPLGNLRIPDKNDLRLTSIKDEDMVYALFSRKSLPKGQVDVTGWDVCVAPGTDPGLCVALSVVLDDMVGWFA